MNPRGLSAAVSTARRSIRKNPVIGSETSLSRIGNIARVSAVETFDTSTRVRSARPADVPSPAYREAITTSTSPAREAGVDVGDLLGRMLQVAVHDETRVGLGRGEALEHGSAESAGAMLAVDQPDGHPGGCGDVADDVGSGIRAVVDEDDLGIETLASRR